MNNIDLFTAIFLKDWEGINTLMKNRIQVEFLRSGQIDHYYLYFNYHLTIQ